MTDHCQDCSKLFCNATESWCSVLVTTEQVKEGALLSNDAQPGKELLLLGMLTDIQVRQVLN